MIFCKNSSHFCQNTAAIFNLESEEIAVLCIGRGGRGGAGKYIASFIVFAPADNPEIIGIVLIAAPTGAYYGGTVAAPVMREIFENVLPYYLGQWPDIESDSGDGNE